MALVPLSCFACHSLRWRATGRFNESRFGHKRAELRCTECNYVFSSGRKEALEAGAAVTEVETPERTPQAQPKPKRSSVGPLADFVRDFKLKQSGERED